MNNPFTSETNEAPPPSYTSSIQNSLPAPVTSAHQSTEHANLVSGIGDQRPGTTAASAHVRARPFVRKQELRGAGVELEPISFDLTIVPSSKAHDFPFPEPKETYYNRDVTLRDWDIFTKTLLPQNRGSASEKSTSYSEEYSATQLEQLRTEAESIVAEWNGHFFGPRSIQIILNFLPGFSRSTPHGQQHQNYQQTPFNFPPPPSSQSSVPYTSSISGRQPSSTKLSNLARDAERAARDLTHGLEKMFAPRPPPLAVQQQVAQQKQTRQQQQTASSLPPSSATTQSPNVANTSLPAQQTVPMSSSNIAEDTERATRDLSNKVTNAADKAESKARKFF